MARRVIKQHGPEDVVLLFADTLFESAGLYQFLDAAIVNLRETANYRIRSVRLCFGKNPWEIFESERFIGNSRVDLCSRILKRELIAKWVAKHWSPEDTIHYFGFDWTEEHRLERLRPYFLPAIVEAPLCSPPYLSKNQIINGAKEVGLPISEAYGMGFSHDNCGGRCVKAGQAHYAKLLILKPDTYADVEDRENKMRDMLGDVSILRDRRGGTTTPLPLSQFRSRVEAGEFDKYDFGSCSCFMPSDPETGIVA